MDVMLRGERGAVEGLVLMATFGLAALTLVLALVAGVLIGHERARTAADFAALAGAQTQECAAAQEAAKRNGAALRSCTLDNAEVRVVISIPTHARAALARIGIPSAFLASAHAGL